MHCCPATQLQTQRTEDPMRRGASAPILEKVLLALLILALAGTVAAFA